MALPKGPIKKRKLTERKAAGLKEIRVWVPGSQHAKIKAKLDEIIDILGGGV